jgi:signal transduction histidine kinase
LRNVATHAGARTVRVDVTREDPAIIRLMITDDGTGFDADRRSERAQEGHVGLSLLEGLVAQRGGTLAVRSQPAHGTTVELEVPAG